MLKKRKVTQEIPANVDVGRSRVEEIGITGIIPLLYNKKGHQSFDTSSTCYVDFFHRLILLIGFCR